MENKYNAFPARRHQIILQSVNEKGIVEIKELTELLGVSDATIRRDLNELDSKGLLERTHGGAIIKNLTTSFEQQQQERMKIMLDEKKKIAKTAAGFIKEGETILLDSGSTTYYLAENLSDIPNLTIITYDLYIASNIPIHPTSNMVVTGGIRRRGYNNVLIGNPVEEYLRTIHVDKTFLGADAIDIEYGVSNSNLFEASIKKLLIKAGKNIFLLADRSKLNRIAFVKVCDITDIDTLIMDEPKEKRMVQELNQRINNVCFV